MDLRRFIELCEQAGQVKRIKAEVDWNLEISHISKINEDKSGPALLFENIKGYDSPVFTGAFTTAKRLSLALGKKEDLSMVEIIKEWMNLTVSMQELVPAQEVKDGPIFENILDGDKVDIFNFPAPKFYELDGGRYIGTMATMVLRDPETDNINIGVYRMGILDSKTAGVQILKGKRGDKILKKYQKAGKKMPACAIIGGDPLLLLSAAAMMTQTNGYDVVSTLRDQTMEIVRVPLTGLPVPATAEIVLEGEIDPDNLREEGPLGEYTGYYTDEIYHPTPKPALEVHRIYYRDNPILWETSGGRPVSDLQMFVSCIRSAMVWTDLVRMDIPGIKSVYVLPESAGQFWAIISLQQMYPGHSEQAGAAVMASNAASYSIKGTIIVDDDINADDLSRVWWALGTRYNPARGTQIFKRSRSAPLDPSCGPDDNKDISSRIILNATIPFDWKIKPTEIELTQSIMDKVKSRWKEYGI